MTTKSKVYADFMHIVCDDMMYEDSSIDYIHICRALKVNPVELDELLLYEIGIDGQSYIERLR